ADSGRRAGRGRPARRPRGRSLRRSARGRAEAHAAAERLATRPDAVADGLVLAAGVAAHERLHLRRVDAAVAVGGTLRRITAARDAVVVSRRAIAFVGLQRGATAIEAGFERLLEGVLADGARRPAGLRPGVVAVPTRVLGGLEGFAAV